MYIIIWGNPISAGQFYVGDTKRWTLEHLVTAGMIERNTAEEKSEKITDV